MQFTDDDDDDDDDDDRTFCMYLLKRSFGRVAVCIFHPLCLRNADGVIVLLSDLSSTHVVQLATTITHTHGNVMRGNNSRCGVAIRRNTHFSRRSMMLTSSGRTTVQKKRTNQRLKSLSATGATPEAKEEKEE